MHACLPVHSTQEGLVTFLSTILGCLLTAAHQRATLRMDPSNSLPGQKVTIQREISQREG